LLRRTTRTLAVSAAVAILAGGTVAVVGLLQRPAVGRVALIGTAAPGESAVVDVVTLSGPAGTEHVDPERPSALAAAPAETDLGVHDVVAGKYTQVSVRLSGRYLTANVDLGIPAGGLVPLLVAVRHGALSAYAGNERVNLGLLLTGGRLTALPATTFTDQAGRQVPLSSLHGRITVIAAFLTHCHESCPLYTAVLGDLERTLHARGWDSRVAVTEVTMDPSRDTPDVLAAYGRMTGATWELLTAQPDALRTFWTALHADYREVPYTGTPPIDWYTGKPETHDVEHSSLAAVLDAQGYPRFVLQGNPRLGHALPHTLAQLLSPEAAARGGAGTWTLGDLLDRIDTLMNLPGEAARGTEASVRPGEPAPPLSLQRLDGGRTSLADELGHPVIVNFWATWCVPCRKELPLLAGAARSTPGLVVLAVDEGEGASDVRSFLHDVLGASQPLLVLLDGDQSAGDRYAVTGLPVSVFIDAGGAVRAVHVGQLSTDDLRAGLVAAAG